MDQIITHVLPMSAFLEGYELVAHAKDAIKVVLDPWLAEPTPDQRRIPRWGGRTGLEPLPELPASSRQLPISQPVAPALPADPVHNLRKEDARVSMDETAPPGPRKGRAGSPIGTSSDGLHFRLQDGTSMPAIGVGTFHGSDAPKGAVESAVRWARNDKYHIILYIRLY